MSVSSRKFQEAGSKRTGEPDVGQGWPVFEEYVETKEDDDIFLEAVVKPVRPTRDPGAPEVEAIFPDSWQDAEERSLKRRIAPITQHKDLFLKFARLALPRSEEEALRTTHTWVSEYGALGLYGVDDPRRPGRRESVSGFVRTALDAKEVLDLYEAAIPKKPPRRLGEVLERCEPGMNWSAFPAKTQREHALKRVTDKVGGIIKDECYPQVYRVENEARQETQGFIYDFGFYSLLGAMYLQMMLLMTDANNHRQCRRPGCPGIIPPGSRKDREYCSNACKQWVHDNREP